MRRSLNSTCFLDIVQLMKWNEHLFYAQIVIILPNLNRLPTFYPLCFPCQEMSVRVSLMWSGFFVCLFLPAPLPLGHCYHFVATTFLFMLTSKPSPSFSTRKLVSQMVSGSIVCLHAHDQWDLLCLHLQLTTDFTSGVITFCFCAVLSSLLANSLFWVSMLYEFITGR